MIVPIDYRVQKFRLPTCICGEDLFLETFDIRCSWKWHTYRCCSLTWCPLVACEFEMSNFIFLPAFNRINFHKLHSMHCVYVVYNNQHLLKRTYQFDAVWFCRACKTKLSIRCTLHFRIDSVPFTFRANCIYCICLRSNRTNLYSMQLEIDNCTCRFDAVWFCQTGKPKWSIRCTSCFPVDIVSLTFRANCIYLSACKSVFDAVRNWHTCNQP